jgi:hypothetical protein
MESAPPGTVACGSEGAKNFMKTAAASVKSVDRVTGRFGVGAK